MLVSIVVTIKDGIEFIPTTLRHLYKYSDLPFEVIIVNDNSEKQTTDFLVDFCNGRHNTKLITNKTTLGYVKSANIGITESSGDIVILMNSDVIVGKNWLSNLCKYFSSDEIMLVSPVTNYAFSYQQVDLHFENIDDFMDTAMEFLEINKNKLKFVPRLVGFCLAIRKKLLDEIGLLDERFSPGNFEDDDLCIRTVIAGYKPAMALDVLVWHLGSKTFGKNQTMFSNLITQNKEKFSIKWSNHILHDKSVFRNLPTLSVAMIVKNEANNLRELLPEIKPSVDEIVIVDTGSTDKTVKVAKSMGVDKVVIYHWKDDFSDARNAGIEKCSKDYILWLDADDRISFVDIFNLKVHLKFFPNTAVFLNLVDRRYDGDYHSVQLRVFPNFKGIRFKGKIHEQVTYDIEKLGIPYSRSNISVVHTGYSSEKKIRKKFERNLQILKKENKDDFMVNLHLARTYLGLEDFNKTEVYINKAIEIASNNSSISRDLVLLAYFTKISLYFMSDKAKLLSVIYECDLEHPLMNAFKAIILFSFQRFEEAYEYIKKISANLELTIIPIDVVKLMSGLQQVKLFSSLYAGDFKLAEEAARQILGTNFFKIGGLNENTSNI